jgi:hypothetical protein
MAKKKFWLGMLAMALVFGMTVVGCDNGSTSGGSKGGGGNTDPKEITVTGIPNSLNASDVFIVVFSNLANDEAVSQGSGTISGTSITFTLYAYHDKDVESEEIRWTGSGSYCLGLFFDDAGSQYVYTGGKTFQQLGITFTSMNDYNKIPKYNISTANSSIVFSQFQKMPD